MVALKIIETKPFMALLLKNTLFDKWETRGIDITTFTRFSIDCHLNKNYYDQDELEIMENPNYVKWGQIKEKVVAIIRGNKSPDDLKIVLARPVEELESFDPKIVSSLFINVHFSKGEVTVTTGTSMATFTLDKSIDYTWDNQVKASLKKQGILFEE